jgi:phosphoribosylformylglycinamidine synthase
VPGGFSYGDDLGAGRILAVQIQTHLRDALRAFVARGKLVLGICNGFQVLLKTGLLLPPDGAGPVATLAWNASGKFQDRWIRLRTEPSPCVFFAGIASLYLPIAHAEGRFVTRDEATLDRLAAAGQLPLRYAGQETERPTSNVQRPTSNTSELGQQPFDVGRWTLDVGRSSPPKARSPKPEASTTLPFPDNPNGSQADVAGVCDATGRVCGLMPHPERHIDPTQHPHWTRLKELPSEGDGLAVFRNAVRYFQ